MTDRRVLVVSYHFPPIGGVGVQRTLKHVIYLPEAGWTPAVVAPKGAVYRLMDPSSVADLPAGLELHRAFCYEPARFRRQVAHAVRLGGGRRAATESAAAPAGGAPAPLNRVWAATVRLLFFPDEQLLWIPFAVRAALRAHRRRRVDALYSSSPPVSSHLVAGLVKRRTGVPWIADFRDPWIGNSYAPPLPRLHHWLRARLERWIVRTADRLVFATPSLMARYAERYPAAAHRFVVIPNGYDRSELASVRQPATTVDEPGAGDDRPFRLVYTGSVYGDDELPIFTAGLALALEERPALRERLRVEFIGAITEPNQRLAEQLRPALGDVLATTGFVPRATALARLAAADAGLLLIAAGSGRDLVVTGKLFEYIGLNRQVLAMVPAGDARTLLKELDWGVVANPEPESVAGALLRLLDSPPPRREADPDRRYDRRTLAARLGGVFDEVVPGPEEASPPPRER